MDNYYSEFDNASVPKSRMSKILIATDKIQKMQKLFQLQVTGKADSTTLDAVRKSRCGVIDKAEFKHYPGKPKWEKKNITYR